MPAIAKLSSKFYEQFGDDVTNELVEWINDMNANAQTQLRELHEVSVLRFRTEQQQGFAEIRQQLAKFEVMMEQRFTEIHRDIARVEVRLAWQLMGIIATFIGVVIALNAALFHR